MRRVSIYLVSMLIMVLVSALAPRAAGAGVYGPNWASEPFVANITIDSFYMKDSNLPAPTNAYNWIDADAWNGGVSTGIDSAQPQVANQFWTSRKIVFGFDFNYFGNTFNGVYVSLNGWCSFVYPGNPQSSSTALPNNLPIDQAPFDDFIAPYWDQLYQTLQNGQVFHKAVTSPMKGHIIEWYDVQLVKGNLNTSCVFQVIFWENGDINFNYNSFNPPTIYGNGASATIGLKAGGSQYLSYGYNNAVITSAGFGILFTYTEPDLPPDVAIGPGNPGTLEEFPYTATAKPVLQFSMAPRNVEGQVDAVNVIFQGPQDGTPAQYFAIYLVRDVNGNGFRDPEDPVVSGVDPNNGKPLLWNPWFSGGYSEYVALLDSPLTADHDNQLLFSEGDNGKKYYLVMAVWGNLQSGDAYNIGIRELRLSGTKFAPMSPCVVNLLGTTLTVADLTAPEVLGPYFYPPDPEQDVDVRAENVVALSYSVTASPDFDAQMVAVGLQKTGSGQGVYVACRIYADYGEHGVFEPGVDVDVTADGWLSPNVSPTGGTLAEGNPSGTFYIFLTTPPDPENPTGHHTFLPKNGGTKYYMVVLTFYQSIANEGDTYRVSLTEIIYTGGPGSPVKLDNPLDGAVLRLKAPDLPLGVINTPFSPDVKNLTAVPGGEGLTVGRFSFRPYNRNGVLHQFTLTASGSGDDRTDVERIKIIFDRNMNGIQDGDDTLYYEGKWPEDNGSITIEMRPPDGNFRAWQGGTTEDYANMINFIVVYDFSESVAYGSTFSYSVSEIQFTFEGQDRTVLPTNWQSPVVTIADMVNTQVSVKASPYTSVRERFLPGTPGSPRNIEMLVIKVTAGSQPIRINSFTIETSDGGFINDGDESKCVDQVLMYPDLNLNGVPDQALGETFSWLGSATARPFLVNNGTVTVFVLEPTFGDLSPYYLAAYQSITWRIFFSFNENVKPGDGFMATLKSMQYELVTSDANVSQPPLNVHIEGGRKEAVGTVMNGGSITITKGPGLATGAVRYVTPGNFIEVNQFRLFAGNVEAVMIRNIYFHFIGSGVFDTPGAPGSDITYIGFANDNGDGIVDYAYDSDFAGNVTVDALRKVGTFTPSVGASAMILNPGTSYYVIVYYIIASNVAVGKTFSCYVGPNDLDVLGGDNTNGWVPRYVGDPVARFGNDVYGWKAVVGTLYDTGGTPGTEDVSAGNDEPDNGNPWSNANVDWTGGGGGGCFVATASFGDYSADTVRSLCEVRDGALSASGTTAGLVSLYYAASPAVAATLGRYDSARAVLRALLGEIR